MGVQYRPCPNYCVDVMRACLHNVVELDTEWNNFVSTMEKVSDRLLGPFNVVNVVEPINIKISEAIMNFQETNKDISGQVFQGCGRPMLGKRKRSVPDNDFLFLDAEFEDAAVLEENNRVKREADPAFEGVHFSGEAYSEQQTGGSNGGRGRKNKGRGNKTKFDYEANREPSLDKLIKDIRQKLKDSKKFWSNLPYQMCNHEDLAITQEHDQCWDGQAVIG